MLRHLSGYMCSMARCCAMSVPQNACTAAALSLGPATLLHATQVIRKEFSYLSEAPSTLWKQPIASATASSARQLLGRKNYTSSNEAHKPSFAFEECVHQVYLSVNHGGQGGSGVSYIDVKEAMARAEGAATQLAPRVGRRLWMLVECGDWRPDIQLPPAMRPGMPARAVFLITDPVYTKKGSKRAADQGYDVFPFILNEKGLPTGEVFKSRYDKPCPTTMEQMTTKVNTKKYVTSFWVVFDNKPLCRLATILRQFSDGSVESPLIAVPRQASIGSSKAARQQTVHLRAEEGGDR